MTMRVLGVVAVFGMGVGIGCAAAPLVVPKASAQQAAQLSKWEYHCIESVSPHAGGWDATLSQMNKLGAESWELVASGGNYCFKRQKM